jgi:Uma2 family endonuclease
MTTPIHPTIEAGPTPLAPTLRKTAPATLPIIAVDLPVMYEDEGQDEMGESEPHTDADHILSMALKEHLRGQPLYRVYSNLNVYYHPIDRRAYVSPDVMVIHSPQPLPEGLTSYRIGEDGPPPILAVEILSRRSFQQQDLTNKPDIYASLGVAEYILVDGSGAFMPELVLLKRRLDERTMEDEQDADGGVTSRLGFRVIVEDDNRPRVIEARSGRRYLRPDEAHAAVEQAQAAVEQARVEAEQAKAAAAAEAEARRQAEDRLRAVEAELARLRGESRET